MIGWVEFTEAGEAARALLDAEGRWSCLVAPRIAERLNLECPPSADPDEEGWGHEAIIKAARQLRGLAWLGSGLAK